MFFYFLNAFFKLFLLNNISFTECNLKIGNLKRVFGSVVNISSVMPHVWSEDIQIRYVSTGTVPKGGNHDV